MSSSWAWVRGHEDLVGAEGLGEEEGDEGEGEAGGSAHDVVAALPRRMHPLQQRPQPPARQPVQRRRALPQQPARVDPSSMTCNVH